LKAVGSGHDANAQPGILQKHIDAEDQAMADRREKVGI
jgi:hypothetical protein